MFDYHVSFWVAFGFAAQLIFGLRFLLQWMASEKAGKSIIPIGFWYLSLAGGVGLLIYATKRKDPVFIVGQLFGCVIYVRNLILIARSKTAHLN